MHRFLATFSLLLLLASPAEAWGKKKLKARVALLEERIEELEMTAQVGPPSTALASSGLTGLPLGTPTATDEVYYVDDTAGTPTSMSSTITSLGASIATVIGGGFTAGSVVFSDGSTLVEDNANLFWDDSANELGVGTTSPGHPLEVKKDQDASTYAFVNNPNAGSGGKAGVAFGTDTSSLAGALFQGSGAMTAYGGNDSLNLVNVLAAPLTLATSNLVRVTVDSAGNVGIGTASPGAPLQVGTDISGGSMPTPAGTRRLWVGDSGSGSTPVALFGCENTTNDGSCQGAESYVSMEQAGGTAGGGIGLIGTCAASQAGAISFCRGAQSLAFADSSGDIGSTAGILIQSGSGANATAASAITTAYGIDTQVINTGSGSITTGYGVYIRDSAGTTDYGVYQVGTDDENYFGGEVILNDTNTGGVAGSHLCIDANNKICTCGSCA